VRIQSPGSEAVVDENGQSMVEFTLAVPVFLGVFLGLAAMALIFFAYLTVTLASREGASAIIHNPQITCTGVRNAVFSAINWVPSNRLQVTPEPACDAQDKPTWVSGMKITVTAVFTVPVPTFSIPDFRGNRIVMFGPFPVRGISNMTVD